MVSMVRGRDREIEIGSERERERVNAKVLDKQYTRGVFRWGRNSFVGRFTEQKSTKQVFFVFD